MATAHSKTVIARVVKLSLSLEEAQTLYHICGNVLGSPSNSPRKHTNAVYVALDALALPKAPEIQTTPNGTLITFKDTL